MVRGSFIHFLNSAMRSLHPMWFRSGARPPGRSASGCKEGPRIPLVSSPKLVCVVSVSIKLNHEGTNATKTACRICVEGCKLPGV